MEPWRTTSCKRAHHPRVQIQDSHALPVVPIEPANGPSAQA
eukprot:CAMPEP_0114268856 /NCGR_PEP_ID=MMETSP0058-20121206/26241_1 /TAXON_ID=36894 /ORGANISM="Pyramimonas parkeae, CCMP726" /LENGTH=40 /DNA_ID= /DNA_START= /DNA_END= /DNA_ORIENTATION=